jgi:hypothetical protein
MIHCSISPCFAEDSYCSLTHGKYQPPIFLLHPFGIFYPPLEESDIRRHPHIRGYMRTLMTRIIHHDIKFRKESTPTLPIVKNKSILAQSIGGQPHHV